MAANSAQPRSDAYVGMLIVSLLAQITGVVFLFLDWSQYPTAKPSEPPTITAPASPGAGGPGGSGAPKGGMPK
jgi:hypothetical protein